MKRILAWFLDNMICVILSSVLWFTLILKDIHIGTLFLNYSILIIVFIYICVCDYCLKGRTIGKYMCGIKGIFKWEDTHCLKYSIVHALWRTLFFIFPVLGVILLWIGNGVLPYEKYSQNEQRKAFSSGFWRFWNKERKIFFILVVILIGGILLVKSIGFLYTQPKHAVYTEKLKELSEQRGVKVQERVIDSENVTSSLEIWLNEDVVITYFDFVSEDDASRYFLDLYETFKKEEDTRTNSCLVFDNYAVGYTTGNELYQFSVRFKDTLFEYVGEMKNKKIVEDFINAVGY